MCYKACILYFIYVFVTQLIFTINVCDHRIYETRKVQWIFLQDITNVEGAIICGRKLVRNMQKKHDKWMNLQIKANISYFSELNACSDLEGRTNSLVAASVSLAAIPCLFLVLYVRLHFYVTKSQPESLTAIIHTV